MAKKTKTNPGFNDMILAAKVRNLALNQIQKILEGKDSDFKNQLILRMAPNVLPRLNEHTGKDGSELFPTADQDNKAKQALAVLLG